MDDKGEEKVKDENPEVKDSSDSIAKMPHSNPNQSPFSGNNAREGSVDQVVANNLHVYRNKVNDPKLVKLIVSRNPNLENIINVAKETLNPEEMQEFEKELKTSRPYLFKRDMLNVDNSNSKK